LFEFLPLLTLVLFLKCISYLNMSIQSLLLNLNSDYLKDIPFLCFQRSLEQGHNFKALKAELHVLALENNTLDYQMELFKFCQAFQDLLEKLKAFKGNTS